MKDVQPNTARALPLLIEQLKRRNFRVVHVVSAQPSGKAKTSGNLHVGSESPRGRQHASCRALVTSTGTALPLQKQDRMGAGSVTEGAQTASKNRNAAGHGPVIVVAGRAPRRDYGGLKSVAAEGKFRRCHRPTSPATPI
jgi:hypothetical protein